MLIEFEQLKGGAHCYLGKKEISLFVIIGPYGAGGISESHTQKAQSRRREPLSPSVHSIPGIIQRLLHSPKLNAAY